MDRLASILLMVANVASLPNINHTKAVGPTMDCYDYSNSGGQRIRATDYIPALRTVNFDNRIGSCCLTGMWILYGEEDYNGYSVGSHILWAYGENFCEDIPPQFDNQASSLRFVGAPDDWKFDTLNIYFNDYFIGDEEYVFSDMSKLNYDNRAMSVIVTGCSPWTLYESDHFEGSAMCVFPSSSTDCTPGLYPFSRALSDLGGKVSSARKGCYARRKVWPQNHHTRTEGNAGASGLLQIVEGGEMS